MAPTFIAAFVDKNLTIDGKLDYYESLTSLHAPAPNPTLHSTSTSHFLYTSVIVLAQVHTNS
jgi:hypothetical protein